MRTSPCWACAYECYADLECPDCGAPPWTLAPTRVDGVYVVAADCGIVKIGYSRVSLERRIAALASQARSENLKPLVTLRGASRAVEEWLHEVFADIHDPGWARMHGLPHHTEWFWPSPAVDRLVAETEFMRDGRPWEEAHMGIVA